MNPDIEQLKSDVAALKMRMDQKDRQQISYPLDGNSITILCKYFLSLNGFFSTVGGAAGNYFSNMIVKQDNKSVALGIWSGLIQVTPNSTTHIITLLTDLTKGSQGKLSNDQFVTIFSPDPGATPTLLDNGGGYFVVNQSGNTIQLSATKGGTAINFTDNGSGSQYIIF